MKIDSSGYQVKFSEKKIQNRLDKAKKNGNQKWMKEVEFTSNNAKYHKKFYGPSAHSSSNHFWV